jgi:hypothetical protein
LNTSSLWIPFLGFSWLRSFQSSVTDHEDDEDVSCNGGGDEDDNVQEDGNLVSGADRTDKRRDSDCVGLGAKPEAASSDMAAAKER